MQIQILLFFIPSVGRLYSFSWSFVINCMCDQGSATTTSPRWLFFFFSLLILRLNVAEVKVRVIYGIDRVQRWRVKLETQQWRSGLEVAERNLANKTMVNGEILKMSQVFLYISLGEIERFKKFRDLFAKSKMGISWIRELLLEWVKANWG